MTDVDDEPRVLVKLYFPLDAHAVALIYQAIGEAYPAAVVGEDGTIWSDSPTRKEKA